MGVRRDEEASDVETPDEEYVCIKFNKKGTLDDLSLSSFMEWWI